mgnify:CR=1 FL=1
MGNLKMNNNVLIITGSDGATAQGLIHYFADKYEHSTGNIRLDPNAPTKYVGEFTGGWLGGESKGELYYRNGIKYVGTFTHNAIMGEQIHTAIIECASNDI